MKHKKPTARPQLGIRVSAATLAQIDALAEAADVSRYAMAEELLLDALAARGVDVEAVSAEAREARRLALTWTGALARVIHAAVAKLEKGEEP